MTTIAFYYRDDARTAPDLEKKLSKLIRKLSPQNVVISRQELMKMPISKLDLLIVLGGDGTIIEAIQKFATYKPKVLGLNLGHIGFLATVRQPELFMDGLKNVLQGNYHISRRMRAKVTVVRGGKQVFSSVALNDVTVRNFVGIVQIAVYANDHLLQRIQGTGALVATATGSTALNLSAHGPIVMPSIPCFIVTELLDHSIPTPSIIVDDTCEIMLVIEKFRKLGRLYDANGGKVDVMLSADMIESVNLAAGDEVRIKKTSLDAEFVELDPHYFFKSLEEKFAFN